METKTEAQPSTLESTDSGFFALDTAFVLFFLAMDTGQRLTFGAEDVLSGITLVMFLVLPFYLPHDGEKPGFGRWVLARTAVACAALVLGMFFAGSLGTVLPEISRFLPLTLLIVAGVVSCCVQFNKLLGVRLAK
jgi:hypothetical protein